MAGSFGLFDKMNDAEARCLSCGAPLPEGRESQQKFTGGNMTVLVLGMDDDVSRTLFQNAEQAIKYQGLNIKAELVTDEEVIKQYNIRKLPALVINGSIVSQGIVCDASDIEAELEYMY